MEIGSKLLTSILSIRFLDILDIIIVAVLIYQAYSLMRETRAEQLIKGLLAIFFIQVLASWLKLYTLKYIIDGFTTYGIITIIVMFQPELRRMLEYIGRSNILRKSITDIRGEEIHHIVEEIVRAVASLSRQKIGALIVFERKTGLTEIVETGTVINAEISSELLINIFIPNTPLHDGAVIIKGDTLRGASAFLPLTNNPSLSKELGTRHRAALGISEKSDCLALVVSEETGAISVAEKGTMDRYIDTETLAELLTQVYTEDTTSFFRLERESKNEED